ncbi:MAG: DnaA regulatory inactivator Hda [Burkholderiales bacterium]
MRQLVLDIAPPDAPAFANFVAGANREGLAAVEHLAAGTGNEPRLYLWGEAGSGKSHLLRAAVTAAGPGAGYVAAADALPAPEAVPRGALLAVDDVDRLDADAQIALFSLSNAAAAGLCRLLVAGAHAPARLRLRPDLATRLGAGLVFRLQPLTDEEKADALRRHAHGRGLRLSDEAISYLLVHARRDLPSLLALLDALDRYSLAAKRAVTVPLIREVLEPGMDLNVRGVEPKGPGC